VGGVGGYVETFGGWCVALDTGTVVIGAFVETDE
jgi:hypothetical protein